MELALRPPAIPLIDSIPVLSTDQMRAVEYAMVHDFGISVAGTTEIAGRSFAELARMKLDGNVAQKAIFVLAGGGNKGGSGMVAARHLANWGAWVVVLLGEGFSPGDTVSRAQLEILKRMEIGLFPVKALGKMFDHADLILDALSECVLSGRLRSDVADLIRCANQSEQRILALDAPSGLDVNSGCVFEPCIRARATLSLGLPKLGLLAPEARAVVGELYLADISIPRQLYAELGVPVPNLFAEATLVKL
jgi:NAD(P)H-hydrate epimerase